MKKSLAFFCVFVLIITLFYPSACINGMSNGIKICLYTLLPSFFPFLVMTNILIKYDLFKYISSFTYPLFRRIFGVSKNGSFVVLTGFTCGYPIGIKTANDMYSYGKISRNEYLHLIKFCNNPSLPFVINYVSYSLLKNTYKPVFLLLFIYGSSALTGIIDNIFFYHKNADIEFIPQNSNASTQTGNVFFMTCKTLINLCSYVLLFSIAISYFQVLLRQNTIFKISLITLTEITSGLDFLSKINNTVSFMPLILIALVTGGLSISAQSISLFESQAEIIEYIKGKFISTFIMLSLFFFLN